MKTNTSGAVIGFPRESTPGDRRTLLTPTVARALAEAGFTKPKSVLPKPVQHCSVGISRR